MGNFYQTSNEILYFRMLDLQARLISAGFSDISFRIINSKLAINGTEGFSMLKHMSGDIPVLQEPQDITSSTWQSILDGGIDHVLVLDRYTPMLFLPTNKRSPSKSQVIPKRISQLFDYHLHYYPYHFQRSSIIYLQRTGYIRKFHMRHKV
jgi:hypothetical protein